MNIQLTDEEQELIDEYNAARWQEPVDLERLGEARLAAGPELIKIAEPNDPQKPSFEMEDDLPVLRYKP
jgi:hypothetical protein